MQRGEILASLDRAAQAKVTLSSAPAGSGKDLDVAVWRMDRVSRIGWQSSGASATSRTHRPFWLAVSAPSGRRTAPPGETSSWTRTPGFSPGAIADRVLAELVARDRTFMVIDDCTRDLAGSAHQLTRLLEKLHPHCNAILASGEPAATASQAPLAGDWPRSVPRICVLRSADPRFLEASGHRPVRRLGAAKLHQTHGRWAAGLRLAAISLASRTDPSDCRGVSGSNRTRGRVNTCSPRCWSTSHPRSSVLLVPRCSTASTASWRTCYGSPRLRADPARLEDRQPRSSYRSIRPGPGFRSHHLFADCSGSSCAAGYLSNCSLHRLAAGCADRARRASSTPSGNSGRG